MASSGAEPVAALSCAAPQSPYISRVRRAFGFVLFLVITLLILGGAHYYLWARLVEDMAWAPFTARLLTVATLLIFLAIPLCLWVGLTSHGNTAKVASLAAYTWLGFLFIVVVLLLSVDAGRLLLRGVQAVYPAMGTIDPQKQQLLARALGAVVAVGGAAIGFQALREGLGRVRVRKVQVALDRLPTELSGTTIVQLSDVHVGPTIGREFVQQIVSQANELRPHLVAITGDLVDGSVESLKDHVAPLRNLRSRYGTYFVTGNHEYYSGARAWCEELARLGIRVLENERVEIGDPAASFDLAGVPDYAGSRRGQGPDLETALKGRDPHRELVLLAHQPKAVHDASRLGVGLVLSGHTHGGQIWPWNYLVRMVQPLVAGLGRFERTWLYVNSGTGYWGPPMRLGAPSEITLLTLVSSESFDA